MLVAVGLQKRKGGEVGCPPVPVHERLRLRNPVRKQGGCLDYAVCRIDVGGTGPLQAAL